ncbi:response regulator [Geitlerinema sp. PCC 7407]|uniref:response regulator n=1 Tax=Geitlerinema sp. PCC 7407 TaxID=1173025 RepID=UPI00029FCB03|nr:response regulator [Geitlerinema sp. PCC 7407]AFY66952.1 response regulator receiver protein [Geitlerinema sp. PCC 7407]
MLLTTETRYRLLLVEDDDVDAMSVQRACQQSKILCSLERASNGREALERLRSAQAGTPSGIQRLILLDLDMPEMGGLEFLRTLRADPQLQSLPVIVLTASESDQDRLEAGTLKIAAYLRKPVSQDSLLKALGQFTRCSRSVG